MKRILILLFLLSFSFSQGWRGRQLLTVDNTKVGGSANHIDFPVLLLEVNFHDDFFDFSQEDGGDIRFSSDSEGSSLLKYELVEFDKVAKTCQIYVKVTLDYNNDTDFYVHYGISGQTTTSSALTWKSGYKGVYHFANNADDSTPNNKDGTINGATYVTNGKISGCYEYAADGSYDEIELPASFFNTGVSDWCITGWVYINNLATTQTIVHNRISLTGVAIQIADGDDRFEWVVYPDLFTDGIGGSLSAPNWYHFAMKRDGSNAIIYLNGATHNNYDSGGSHTPTSRVWDIGHYNNSLEMNGKIDELRFYEGNLSLGWVNTEYNNSNSPSTFISYTVQLSIPLTNVVFFGMNF